ncbi:MAG: hypothetical protein LBF59_08245, partial [Prevotellaceae bacterium]|nr:hypothetical protein [Prevotellaceae bacterium]
CVYRTYRFRLFVIFPVFCVNMFSGQDKPLQPNGLLLFEYSFPAIMKRKTAKGWFNELKIIVN